MVAFTHNPIMWRIRYVNGEVIDTTRSISSVIGTAFHHAMQAYYGGNEDMVVQTEADAMQYALEAGTSFLEAYADGYIEYTKNIPTKQKAIEKLVFAINSYIKENPYDNGDEIISTEEKMVESIDVEWRGKRLTLNVPLKGYPDKVVRRDGKLVIVDYKTTGAYTPEDKIDGAKIIQAVAYYLLVYARYGEEPERMVYEEVKTSKNMDGGPQVRRYDMVYADNDLYFDLFFRLYEDITKALLGEMVYVPNLHALWDNEVALISYIHRLDVPEEVANKMRDLKVKSVTDVLKKEIQKATNMKKLLQNVERQFISAKNLNYADMTYEERIAKKLLEHGMMLQFDSVVEGATVDLYRYVPSIGIKMSRIEQYGADVEQVLGISGVRVLAPIPQSTLVGFEVPRKERTFPKLDEEKRYSKHKLLDVAIGQDVYGNEYRFNLAEAPHLLVAGASGSGKSVLLSSIISQLSGRKNVEMSLCDPKIVELSMHRSDKGVVRYESDLLGIYELLQKKVAQMNGRYTRLAGMGARSIEQTEWDYQMVIIDEYGDIVMHKNEVSKEIERMVFVLAQKARAAGIHLIITTQRPSVDVISGVVKANFPTKVCLRTAKEADSRVVIDESGAEKLVGKGDMLFASDAGIIRLQGYTLL